MSIYGPKIELPHFELPEIKLPFGDNESLKGIGTILIVLSVVLLLAAVILFAVPSINFKGKAVELSFSDAPLDLSQRATQNVILNITLRNNTTKDVDIQFKAETKSTELLIACVGDVARNVAPDDIRLVNCKISANPDGRIFAGNYTITVNTNLGSESIVLQVKK
jgi:hypothetical protein